jgi:hypothetical protein
LRTLFVEGVEIEVGIADALPWVREDMDVVGWNPLVVGKFVIAIVVLGLRKVREEADVSNSTQR